ncbi:hypothetical protein [Pajaroellobacter abortibovis]|uniref:hypothetical protein n=1 Tax=Pajaroellobacter abortibovis TaxID=1882918 RepID=UPI0012EB890E|nr:hypothetical protein [Pajaroellobacter abortibovis]
MAFEADQKKEYEYNEYHLTLPDHRGICNVVFSRFSLLHVNLHYQIELSFPKFYVEDPLPFRQRLFLRRPVIEASVEIGQMVKKSIFEYVISILPFPSATLSFFTACSCLH